MPDTEKYEAIKAIKLGVGDTCLPSTICIYYNETVKSFQRRWINKDDKIHNYTCLIIISDEESVNWRGISNATGKKWTVISSKPIY